MSKLRYMFSVLALLAVSTCVPDAPSMADNPFFGSAGGSATPNVSNATGILPTANGGTGLASIGGMGTCLQSTGSVLTYGACGGSVSITAATPNIVATPSPLTGTGTLGTTNATNAQGTAAAYSIVAGDMTKTVTHSNATAVAVTLPRAGTTGFLAGAAYTECNYGAGIVTITSTISTVGGQSSMPLNQYDCGYLMSDGTNWNVFAGKAPTEHISYQPGLLTALNATKAAFHKFSKATTVDNIEGSAATFSCVGNPVVTMFECGTSTTCATPTTIGTVTVTAAGAVVDGTISSAAIAAGDYVAFAETSGTCASSDIALTAQVHTN